MELHYRPWLRLTLCVCHPGERNSGLSQLRDVILTNLADQLQRNRFGSEEDDHYRSVVTFIITPVLTDV